jgi:hypothetical protein
MKNKQIHGYEQNNNINTSNEYYDSDHDQSQHTKIKQIKENYLEELKKYE